MNRFFAGSVCLLALMLSGCGAVALGVAGSASSNVDRILKHDYAKYVIGMQDAGAKNEILLFDKWFEKYNKELADYGTYFNLCKMYPKQNEGGPLDYKEWSTIKPRLVAHMPEEAFSSRAY